MSFPQQRGSLSDLPSSCWQRPSSSVWRSPAAILARAGDSSLPCCRADAPSSDFPSRSGPSGLERDPFPSHLNHLCYNYSDFLRLRPLKRGISGQEGCIDPLTKGDFDEGLVQSRASGAGTVLRRVCHLLRSEFQGGR